MTIFQKPAGQRWLLHTLPGSTEVLIESGAEAVWDTDFGITVFHPDAAKTMTVFPQHALTMVRSYGENEYRDRIRYLTGIDAPDKPELVQAEVLEIGP